MNNILSSVYTVGVPIAGVIGVVELIKFNREVNKLDAVSDEEFSDYNDKILKPQVKKFIMIITGCFAVFLISFIWRVQSIL